MTTDEPRFDLAMNTDASGLMFTLHATSAIDALARIEDLVRFAGVPALRRTISRFVHMIVYLEINGARKRRVADVLRVLGVDAHGEYVLEQVEPA